MTGHDDPPPPSYDESAPSAPPSVSTGPEQADQVAVISAPARRAPPVNAQRAQAPLSVVRSNESLKGDYIVSIGENKAGPDVLLKTTNAQVKACVYLQGIVPRAAEVNVETTNAGIATVFPDKDEGQAVVFNVKTTNSKVQVAFPASFNGIVTARTSNAKIYVSDGLKPNSVIVPNALQATSSTTTYRIRPHGSLAGGDVKDSDDSDVELDLCHIQTSNSSISLGYLDEVDQVQSGSAGKNKESSSCLLS